MKTMKTLLTDPSADLGPATVLVVPERSEGQLRTLAGDPVAKGIVTESCSCDVLRALHEAANRQESVEDVRKAEKAIRSYLTEMTRALFAYENGSPIFGGHWTRCHVRLEDAEAVAIDQVPGLTVGDLVVIGPPAERPLVNARGRVCSIDGVQVLLSLDADDLRRMSGSIVDSVPSYMSVPRHCLEYAEPNRWVRKVGNIAWRLEGPTVRPVF